MSKRLTTPKGKAVYPHINTPDTAFGQNHYTCKLHVSEEDYRAFEANLKSMYDKAYEAECTKHGKKFPHNDFPVHITPDGDFEIKTRQAAEKGNYKFTVAVVDSKGEVLPNPPLIGSGSVLRLGVEPSFYVASGKFGVSLRLRAAQILELVEVGGAGGSFSFTAEEDGYVGNGESFNLDEEKSETVAAKAEEEDAFSF